MIGFVRECLREFDGEGPFGLWIGVGDGYGFDRLGDCGSNDEWLYWMVLGRFIYGVGHWICEGERLRHVVRNCYDIKECFGTVCLFLHRGGSSEL